ncbi:MAG: ParB/RepB/Spo0J family partition protein [Candidatus Binataceae bacterium]
MRKPLGRGLDALIESTVGEAAAPASTDQTGGPALSMVAPERIAPSPFQPRRHFDPDALSELTEAIKSQGVIEPLIVRRVGNGDTDAGYELIAGERRLRAARAAGLSEVPVIVRQLDDRAALEMSLVENLSREDLNAVEEGRAFMRLNREFGLSHDDIATRIGKSRPYVTNAIRLLELPIPVIELIMQGVLTTGQVRPLLALGSTEEQIAAARRIAEGGISARGAEEIVHANRAPKPARAPAKLHAVPVADPNITALVDSVQRALKRKVRIVPRQGNTPGRLELDFYNDDDLGALARILTVAGSAISSDVR